MSLSEKNRKKSEKFQIPKSCRQLPQHLIHTVFQIFHKENQDNQPLLRHILKILSGSSWSISKFPLSMLILGQKSCFSKFQNCFYENTHNVYNLNENFNIIFK